MPTLHSDPQKKKSLLLSCTIGAVLCCALAVCAPAPSGHDEDPVADAQIDPNAMPIDVNRGAAGLGRSLLQLGTRASLLMVTAHPDDEDGGMLAYESRHVGARTMLLTLNRGEGGQNAMSTDFYDALGIVRTQELLQADRYYGVQQFWGTVIDYGFSKTREEALQQWGYERVLSDTVRVVRMTRPLIITSVFAGAPTDGHGNHQVSGQMAQEVFAAAADPNRFPEQIRQGLRPWKPLKVYARVPFFAPTKDNKIYDYATDKYVPVRFYNYADKTWINHTPETNVSVPEGTLDPAAGLTFAQISRTGWGFQKTQNGGGTTPLPNLISTPYHRYASRVSSGANEASFYDGIDISLNGIASLSTGGDTAFLKDGLSKLSTIVQQTNDQYRPENPGLIAPALSNGLTLTRKLIEDVKGSSLSEPGKSDIAFELTQKSKQFEQALTMAVGLWFDAAVVNDKEKDSGPFSSGGGPTFTIAIPGQHFSVQARLLNGGSSRLAIESIDLASSDGKDWTFSKEHAAGGSLDPAKDLKCKFAVSVPTDATIVRPYFTRPSQEQPYYNLTDERFRNLSFAPYPLIARARVRFGESTWTLQKIVQTTSHVNGVGTVQDPLLVAPALSVSVVSGVAGAVPLESKSIPFACSIRSNVKGPAKGTLRLMLPKGWHSDPESRTFDFARDGDSDKFHFKISPAHLEAKNYEIRAVATYQGKSYSEGYQMVGYPGVRPYPYYLPAVYRATGVDVKSAPGLRVGFVPGTGDDIPQALENLGVDATTLSGDVLATGQLSQFDAIILGVRAYSVRNDLRAVNARLLNYVKEGGVLIVQYNLQTFDDGYAPYKISLGSSAQKVVDENSAVEFLSQSHPALTWPNKITPDDFKDWEEERGHGFMESWSKEFVPLFETHDPEQPPQKGGLLVAKYGKGFYIYDAFALYRQLPAGVPGAYRILANLVSLKKNPAGTAN
jgi:LmbE family N-acetylglucosaminyl deacetylase